MYGFNKTQSFIDFETTAGKLRLGMEDLRIFVEVAGNKEYLSGTTGAITFGSQGTSGVQGATGLQGPSGGPQGTTGLQGTSGAQGAQGVQGVQGIA